MKGLAYRKLGRTSSHRRALLRNLVTSLIQHQRISTTYAKAKEAQRVAERIITKAKRGLTGEGRQMMKATSYVFEPKTTVPHLQQLAERFRDRPGGYTRIHLHGHRIGDHAPRALLEFVDQPRGDLKLEITAMTIGRELFLHAQKQGGASAIQRISTALDSTTIEHDERFDPLTRKNAQKVLRYGGDAARTLLVQKAREQFFRLMATHELHGDHRVDEERTSKFAHNKPRGNSGAFTPPMTGLRRMAGMRRDVLQSGPQEPLPIRRSGRNSVVRIGKGAFASRRMGRRVIVPPAIELASRQIKTRDAVKDKYVN